MCLPQLSLPGMRAILPWAYATKPGCQTRAEQRGAAMGAAETKLNLTIAEAHQIETQISAALNSWKRYTQSLFLFRCSSSCDKKATTGSSESLPVKTRRKGLDTEINKNM